MLCPLYRRHSLFFIPIIRKHQKGNRIDNCRDVLKSFVEQNCQNETLLIKLVMFDDRGDIYDIPRDQTQAGAVIQAQVKDKGGTNFHEASKGLVTAATKILDENPTFQVF